MKSLLLFNFRKNPVTSGQRFASIWIADTKYRKGGRRMDDSGILELYFLRNEQAKPIFCCLALKMAFSIDILESAENFVCR